MKHLKKKNKKVKAKTVIYLAMATNIKMDIQLHQDKNFAVTLKSNTKILFQISKRKTKRMIKHLVKIENDMKIEHNNTDEDAQHDEEQEFSESPRKKLNTSLESVGLSPINFHAVPQHSRVTRAKSKLKSVMEKYQESISNVYNLPIDELDDINKMDNGTDE